ncbi:MAG: ABC transporter substrate-binding protein [Actinomycetota bacterium]
MGRSLALSVASFVTALSLPAASVATVLEPTGRGVTDSEIKVGVHIPSTGAVPLPSTSAERGAKLYWEWLRRREVAINGRYVDVAIANDNTNPTQAQSECERLIEEENSFMLWGALQAMIGGSSSVIACARKADELGAPYVSLGNSKVGLRKLDRYFATSESLAGQTRAMAAIFEERLDGKTARNGLVWWNPGAYAPLADVFEAALDKRGMTLDASHDVPVTAGATHAQTVAAQLKAMGIENVFVIATPTFMIQLVQAANNQSYFPNWTTMGFSSLLGDNIAQMMCSPDDGFDGTLALSPVPAFDDRAAYDPTYDEAIDAIYPEAEGGDMTTWLGWSAAKQLRRLLEAPGRKLTPARFAESAETGGPYSTRVIPRFGFTDNDHFGGRKSYLLQVDCAEEGWRTIGKR